MIKENNFKHFLFTGPLAKYLENYVLEKRGLGIKFNASGTVLKNFDKFSTQNYNISDVLNSELIESWAKGDGTSKNATIRMKIIIISGFGEYMARLGYPSYIPRTLPLKRGNVYAPYIFSDEEIMSLINAADCLEPVSSISVKHLVIPTMIRVLYCCGLRISEASKLLVTDVDLNNGILNINESKNNKKRLVPMSDTLTEVCRNYSQAVHSKSLPSAFYFPNVHNEMYRKDRFYKTFRKLLWEVGISHGGRGKGPRVHDLRHSFSVHCLRNMVRDGTDINAVLPYLSVYLGHNSLIETQFYLRLTVDLFPDITKALTEKLGDIIPTIGDDCYYEE